MAKAQTREQLQDVILPVVRALAGADRIFDGYATRHGTAYADLLVRAFVEERARGLGKDMIGRATAFMSTVTESDMTAVTDEISARLVSHFGPQEVRLTPDTDMIMVQGNIHLKGSYAPLSLSAAEDRIVIDTDDEASPARIGYVRSIISEALRNPLSDMTGTTALIDDRVGMPSKVDRKLLFPVPGYGEEYLEDATIGIPAIYVAHAPLWRIAPFVTRQVRTICERAHHAHDAKDQARRIGRMVSGALEGTGHDLLSVRPADPAGIAFHHKVDISGLGDDLRPATITMMLWPANKTDEDAIAHFLKKRIGPFLTSQKKLRSQAPPSGIGDYRIERPLARMLKEKFGEGMVDRLQELVKTGTYTSGRHMPASSGACDVNFSMRMDRGVIRGRFELAKGANWHDGSLKIPGAIVPETVMQDARGRPMTALVAHRWLDDDMTIETIARGSTRGITLSAHGSTCLVADAL